MRITVVINAPRFSSEENRTYTFYDRGSAYFFYHNERERMGNRFMGGCAYDENHMTILSINTTEFQAQGERKFALLARAPPIFRIV